MEGADVKVGRGRGLKAKRRERREGGRQKEGGRSERWREREVSQKEREKS